MSHYFHKKNTIQLPQQQLLMIIQYLMNHVKSNSFEILATNLPTTGILHCFNKTVQVVNN